MQTLKANGMRADFIISHDGPASSQAILGGGAFTPDPLTKYLEKIKQKTNYGRCFFGHYHMDHQITTQDAVIYHQITRIS